jgi:hypothetical protein
MGKRMVQHRLKKTGQRLRSLREELGVIDEQLVHLGEDAADAELRALGSETPQGTEPREARGQVDAMTRHRAHVVAEIHRLEVLQDQLLDELNRSS